MPGYNYHRLFNYAIFIFIAFLMYEWNITSINLKHLLVFLAGYYAGTEFITPDLDTDSAALKKWGRLKILWLPYKWLFEHGKSSHNIMYGAIVRIIYVSAIILGIYYLLFKSLPPGSMISSLFFIVFIMGIIIANAMHIVLDFLF